MAGVKGKMEQARRSQAAGRIVINGKMSDISEITNRHAYSGLDRGPEGSTGGQAEGLSLFRVGSVLLRQWRLVIFLPLAFAVIALAVSLMRERTFSTVAAFVPQGSQSAQSQLSGLASQFGVSLSTGDDAGQSPRFYESLLKTNDILGAIVDSTYQYQDAAREVHGTLAELLDTKGATPSVRRAKAIKQLKELMSSTTDKETGIVRVTVQTPWASVSQQIASRLIGLVNNFNLVQRQRQAAAERDFVEGRLSDARAQLRVAEDELQYFLQRNRQYAGDPQLMAAHDRLERSVTLRQQVYASLAQMYEQASLTVMRNTPLIAVVEQPRAAVEADPKGVIPKTILALVLGLVLAVALAFTRSLGSRAREEGSREYSELVRLYREMLQDLRRLWPWHARA